MADNFNTTAGWALASAIVALGLTTLSHRYFEADKNPRPEKMGYAIAGVAVETEGPKVSLEELLAKADPAKGEAQFKKCMSCHTIASGGPNGIGPNLFGILGKPIGKHAAGFAYSPDLASQKGNWDFATLDHWVTSPKAMVATTKMTFPGLDDAQGRADLIAYINTQGSNLPLPKPAAAAPAGDGAAAPADAAKK